MIEFGDTVMVNNSNHYLYGEIGEVISDYGDDFFLVLFCYNSRIFEDESILLDSDDLELVP